MLKTYQAVCLVEFGSLMPPDIPLEPHLNKVRVAPDYILCVCRCVVLSLCREMAFTVVMLRHLRLTLSDVPDKDKAVHLDKPTSAESLFRQ